MNEVMEFPDREHFRNLYEFLGDVLIREKDVYESISGPQNRGGAGKASLMDCGPAQ